jgi:DNA-binding XRE family transcriptional regulator
MKQYKRLYSITKMAKIFGVSRGGYYTWEKRKITRREKTDIELSALIKKIFKRHWSRY